MKKLRSIETKFLLFLTLVILIIIISLFFLILLIDNRQTLFIIFVLLTILGASAIGLAFKRLTIPIGEEFQATQKYLETNKKHQREIIQTETHKSLTSIVSGFAHEINNPLTGILGYIDLIELNNENSLSPHSRRRLEGIKDQALRIKEVIDELNQLDPEIEQTKTTIDLSNLLDKLIKIIEKQEENKKIVIEKEFVKDELIVFGNHFALYQVFEGIIENSIESITDRGISMGKIRVITRIDPEKKLAVTEVADNGGGFENIDKAFNPFYTTKNRTQKRGIGLSITFNMIREHKGNISIRNNDDGAVVTVFLPLFDKKGASASPEENTTVYTINTINGDNSFS
ncbi:MAG: sensor histidine kinase [Candidatus Omnitrophota bacterium]